MASSGGSAAAIGPPASVLATLSSLQPKKRKLPGENGVGGAMHDDDAGSANDLDAGLSLPGVRSSFSPYPNSLQPPSSHNFLPPSFELGGPIKGIPPIHTACIDGDMRAVEYILRLREEDVEAQDIVGSRPLHVAACYGHIPIIRLLIQHGADINARDNYQSVPLVVASNAEVVELLVSLGASIDIKNVNNISARSISLGEPVSCLGYRARPHHAGETKAFHSQNHSRGH